MRLCHGCIYPQRCLSLFSTHFFQLFTAPISAGESPGFAWIRANINICMGLGLVSLILVSVIHLRQMRQSSFKGNRLLPFLICLEVFSVAIIALLLYSKRAGFLAPVYTILMLSILGQGVIAFRRLVLADCDHQAVMLQKPTTNMHLFLFCCLSLAPPFP